MVLVCRLGTVGMPIRKNWMHGLTKKLCEFIDKCYVSVMFRLMYRNIFFGL